MQEKKGKILDFMRGKELGEKKRGSGGTWHQG